MRYAIIKGGADSFEQLVRYMPGNYGVIEFCQLGQTFYYIEGEDRFGWTLDDYVIPRLASGLIWATEIPSLNLEGGRVVRKEYGS